MREQNFYISLIKKIRNTFIRNVLLWFIVIILLDGTCYFLHLQNVEDNLIQYLDVVFITLVGIGILFYKLVKIGKINAFLQEPIYVKELEEYDTNFCNGSIHIKGIYNGTKSLNYIIQGKYNLAHQLNKDKYINEEDYVIIVCQNETVMILQKDGDISRVRF